MARVDIPFQPYWEEAMLSGRKTCTTRPRRYGNPGDTFAAFGAEFEIVTVTREQLGKVAFLLFDIEGCDSPEHFIDIWNQLHPRRGFQTGDERWAHRFRRLS